jgi:hypothetical protein
MILRGAYRAYQVRRRRGMNKEYWQAKAELCRDLALIQIEYEETEKEAGMNLMRMVHALSMVEAFSEGKGENE